jgi:NADH-ubiquinone oxidoreductase chain 2
MSGIPQGTLKIIQEYPIIIIFSVLGISCLISSNDLITIFLSIELQSLAVYILASVFRDSESATSAGLLYFLLGSLSSAIILLGSGLVYGYTGLTEFEGLYMLCSTITANQYILFSVLLIIVGLLFKVAAAPFHIWSPNVYEGVPTIVTAWIITIPKISLLIFMVQFIPTFAQGQISSLLLISSLFSLVVGSLGGLSAIRIKKLLTYSTISHVGMLLLALSLNTSLESLLLYLFIYSITNVNIFYIIIILGVLLPNRISIYSPVLFISQLKGVFSAYPLLSISLSLSLFSLAGIPPLAGFFAKFIVLYSALYIGTYFVVFISILTSVLSAVYYLIIIRVIFFDNLPFNSPSYSPDFLSSFIISVLTIIIVFFCVYPNFLINSIHLIASSGVMV